MDAETRNKLIEMAAIGIQIVVYLLTPVLYTLAKKARAAAEAKIGKEAMAAAEFWADKAVKGIEQKYPDLKGEGKLKPAMAFLNKKTGGNLTTEEMDFLIHAAVEELNLSKKPAAPLQIPPPGGVITLTAEGINIRPQSNIKDLAEELEFYRKKAEGTTSHNMEVLGTAEKPATEQPEQNSQ